MIRNGDIEPMIIVTPTFNKVSADTFYNAENFYKEFRASVVPFAEGKCATYAKSTTEADLKASRMHRAYGGGHDWFYLRQYVYDCLPFFFRQ